MLQFEKRPGARFRAVLGLGLIFAGAAFYGANAPAGAAATGWSTGATLVPTQHLDTALSGNRWLGVASLTFNPGQTAQFVHEDCPANYPHVVNGAFAFNSVGQTTPIGLGFNGPRIDESPPFFGEWGWEFYIPNGVPAGLSAQFSIYCTK